MADDAPKSVGTTLYLELEKITLDGNSFAQLIITPPGMTAGGARVPVTLYHRSLTEVRRRATWKVVQAREVVSTGFVSSVVNAYEIAGVSFEGASVRDTLAYTLVRLSKHGYRLKRVPIYVETSIEDMDVLFSQSTPYKLIARIDRTRSTLGWPKEITTPAKAGV